MNTGNFGNLINSEQKRIYGESYNEYPSEYDKFLEVRSSNKAYELSLSMSTFGQLAQKSEGGSVTYDTAYENWLHTLTNVTYGLGYTITRELAEDDQFNKINMYPKALKRSVMNTRETIGANILNNAFDNTYTGGDGLELCSTAHLLGGGGTYRNELASAADLSETSLNNANIDIQAFTDDRGKLIMARPKMLVVSPSLEWEARKLLRSVNEVGSANNDINPAKDYVPYMVSHFMSDTDAWFIITDVPNGLVWYDRRKPEFTRDNDFDAENAKFKVTFRCVAGWDDPRGIYGSPGA